MNIIGQRDSRVTPRFSVIDHPASSEMLWFLVARLQTLTLFHLAYTIVSEWTHLKEPHARSGRYWCAVRQQDQEALIP